MDKQARNANKINFNPKIRTAIIYSIDDIFAYLVQIREGNHNYYICNQDNKPLQFGNMADARQAALKEHALEAYLALSKTYQENDLSAYYADPDNRYDYSPLTLNVEKEEE